MAEGRSHPRGEQFARLNSELAQGVAHFTQLLSGATAFGQAVSQFRTLEVQLALTNAAARGNVTTFNQMEQAARSFALATTASAQEAASALFFLAQAGFTTEQSLNALSAVMILSQATMQDVGFTSDLVSSTLRTYNMTSLDAARVANIFAASQANSLASLDKLAFSLRQVGPVASAMGQELETTVAILNELYNVGLRGEQAGTALRNIMVRLIDPPKSAAEVLKKYGVATRETTGEIRDLEEVLLDLYNANGGRGISEADASALFGVEALAGALTAIEAVGTGAFDAQRDAITGTSAAYEMAAAQLETLDGALKLARNSVNDLFIGFGKELAPIVVYLAETVRELVNAFQSLDPAMQSMIVTSVLAAGGLTTLIGALRTMSFLFSPLTAGAAGFFGAFARGSADGTVKAGLFMRALTGIGTALRYIFMGGMVASIANFGAMLTGLTVPAARILSLFTGIGALRFLPLLAGLGGVGVAIAGAAGLIYVVSRLGAAWQEQTRIAQEELAKQQAALLEAAGLTNAMFDNMDGRARRRDTQMNMADGLPVFDQIELFRGVQASANTDAELAREYQQQYEDTNGALIDLDAAMAKTRETAESMIVNNVRDPGFWDTFWATTSGSPIMAGQAMQAATQGTSFEVDPAAAIARLEEQVAGSQQLFDGVKSWLDAQYTEEVRQSVITSYNDAVTRQARAERDLAELQRYGQTSGDLYESTVAALEKSQADIAFAQKEFDRFAGGIENDEGFTRLSEALAASNQLATFLAQAKSDGVISNEEADQLVQFQNILVAKNEALSERIGASLQAAREQGAALIERIRTADVQGASSGIELTNAANDLFTQLSSGEVATQEIFGKEAATFQQFLKDNNTVALATLTRIVTEENLGLQDSLLRLVSELQATGVAVPQSLLDVISNLTAVPIDRITVAVQENRTAMIAETARIRNDMRLAQADVDNNLAAGIEAMTLDATLDAIEGYGDTVDDFVSTLSQQLGESWSGIQIDEAMAEAMGIQYEAGLTLGDYLNATSFLDGATEAAANGESADAVAKLTDEAIVAFMERLVASLTAVSATMDLADPLIAEEAARLNETVATFTELMNAVREMRTAGIANAPTTARTGHKFSPGRGGGGAADEAQKLQREFEKELLSIRGDLNDAQRQILEFDGTIDLTARFTAMLEIDRDEIRRKYEAQLLQLRNDIEDAKKDFAGNPVALNQLVTGYSELVSEIERAMDAEIAYTDTFTYQAKLREEAINAQIDAIRNSSNATGGAINSVVGGVQAGLLEYQKGMLTTVDNVSAYTTGTLDGIAEAIGQSVTRQGSVSFKEALKAVFLDQSAQLITNGAKRLFQELADSITSIISSQSTGTAALAGGGGDGGFLASLIQGFIGLFDSGGDIPLGKWGIVGERRPEIVKGPASVVGGDETAAMLGGRNQNVVFNIQTKDANSFRRSRSQILSDLSRASRG